MTYIQAVKKIELNFDILTPNQYGQLFDPPKSVSAVTRMCTAGELDCYKTEGGHWKIKVPRGDTVTRAEYDAVARENQELKAILKTINKMSG